MSELDLPKCPICHAEDTLFRQNIERAGRPFTWYECHECGSVLLWMGDDQWAYQKVGREDKAHLLKQPIASSELEHLLAQSRNDVPEAVPSKDAAGYGAPGTEDSGMLDSKACPYCAEEISVEATVCPYCGRDVVRPPAPGTEEQAAEPRRGRGWLRAVAVIVVAALALVVILKVGFYTVQPIGALPEGRTLIVWRNAGEPFFNSPDAMCLRNLGEVSLLCRGVALTAGPMDRIILRLPYMKWAYLLSTGGREFTR